MRRRDRPSGRGVVVERHCGDALDRGAEHVVDVVGGFGGCWVIGLGTNDAANIAAGAGTDAATRIERMLIATQSGPVLSLDASTTTAGGAWALPNLQAWNELLRAETAASDRVTVAPRDALAKNQPWFIDDGIHPNAARRAEHAEFGADQLFAVFPS